MKKSWSDIKRDLEYSPSLTFGIAVLITILFTVQPDEAVAKYGLAIELVLHEPWRFVTNHFIHTGASHFAMNVFGLIFLAGILENAGMKKVHLLQGILSSMFFSDFFVLISQMIRSSIVVGFSGVVYGLVGMMVTVVGRQGVFVLAILFFGFGIFLSGSNIAWSGHIGGFIGGLILGEKIR